MVVLEMMTRDQLGRNYYKLMLCSLAFFWVLFRVFYFLQFNSLGFIYEIKKNHYLLFEYNDTDNKIMRIT